MDEDEDSQKLSLGEVSFDVFYPGDGFRALKNIIDKYPNVLERVQIFDDYDKKYEVDEFLNEISKYKMKK